MTASAEWFDPIDPSEIKDYSLLWGAETSIAADNIVDSTWELSPEAVAAGVLVHADTHDDSNTTLWLKVDVAEVASALWDGAGTTFEGGAVNTVTTFFGRTYQRSVSFTVKQL